MLESEMLKALNEFSGERAIASFLAKNCQLIRWSVCRTGGHSTYIIKEFPFGSKFKADFTVAMSYSFGWEVHLIELEPPSDKVITRAGLPTNRLNKAISQINDWRMYIEQNPMAFKQDLTQKCMKRDLLREIPNDKTIPTNNTGNNLNAFDTVIRFHYYIVIGMRENLCPFQREKMNQIAGSNDIEIYTYGRILDVARQIDKYKANPNQSFRLTESEEE